MVYSLNKKKTLLRIFGPYLKTARFTARGTSLCVETIAPAFSDFLIEGISDSALPRSAPELERLKVPLPGCGDEAEVTMPTQSDDLTLSIP